MKPTVNIVEVTFRSVYRNKTRKKDKENKRRNPDKIPNLKVGENMQGGGSKL